MPTGSAGEHIHGISHLLEHYFILQLREKYLHAKVTGHTTEDYIILFCTSLTPETIIQTMRAIRFDDALLEKRKLGLKHEIEIESSREEEYFFRFAWAGTPYEKSPLGTIEQVDIITVDTLDIFRRRLLLKNFFFYSPGSTVKILNPSTPKPLPPDPVPPIPIAWHRDKTFQGKQYDICYFNRHIEEFYLLERMLKSLNPQMHIQLSEKKLMSALIMEQGTRFPTAQQVESLKPVVLSEIVREVSAIKSNLMESALNRLESMFFYNLPWSRRIQRIHQTSNGQLLELVP